MRNEKDIHRYIDLSQIKTKYGIGANSNRITYDWKSAEGLDIYFEYDKSVGSFHILHYIPNKISMLVYYNQDIIIIGVNQIRDCSLDKLIHKDGYKYRIGDILNVKSGKIQILELTKKRNRVAYKYKCLNDGYNQIDYEYNIDKGIGCPVCVNKKVVIGINDLWTTKPDIAKLLYDKNDGYKYSYGSGKLVKFECPICHDILEKHINDVVSNGLMCPCNKTKSYPNLFMYNLLKYLNVNFKDEKIFDWSKNINNKINFRRYDFYLHDYNCIIEMNGKQHYDLSGFKFSTLEYQQYNDKLKYDLAIKNGIDKYIVINAYYSDIDWIKDNIITSDFLGLLHINENDIDWNYIDNKSRSNIYEEIIKIWDKYNHDVTKISDVLHINRSYCLKQIKYANDNKRLTYNNEESEERRIINCTKSTKESNSKPIICLDLNKYFSSVTEANKYFCKLFNQKECKGRIFANLKGRSDNYRGYHFEYITKEEFNHQKDINPDNTYGEKFIKLD